MKHFKYLVLLLFFLSIITPFNLKAQNNIESFTPDSIAFYDEMGDFLKADRDKEGKDFMKKFKVTWYGGVYTKEQRKGIYKMTNLMLQNDMRPFPDFVNYLNTVSSFISSKYQSDSAFTSWQGIVKKLIKKKGRHAKKIFSDYLQDCSYLFDYDIIFSSGSKEWAAGGARYIFGYDSLPKMTFLKTNLTCYSKNDSIMIYDTRGTYYPTTHKWFGYGGKINWVRSGYPDDSVYAFLKTYTLNMEHDYYKADSVTFFDKYFFDKPLQGRMEDKVKANVSPKNAIYPLFYSYSKRVKIDNITKDVDYEGGFTLKGRKILGNGSEKSPSQLTFFRKDTLFLIAKAKTFVIEPTTVRSNRTAVTLYLNTDSIYHPGLDFKLFLKKREVILYRDGTGLSGIPYTDTYHKLNMDIERVIWNIDEPKIIFTYTKSQSQASFTSFNYFDVRHYDRIQGINRIHPLIKIRDLYKKTHKKTMPLMALANEMHFSVSSTKTFVQKMAIDGYLSYNFTKEEFTINDTLFHDVFAKVNKVDYDILKFISNPKEGTDNGRLSLVNNDIYLNGVKQIFLSDSQRVGVIPDSRKVEIRKNRDFVFDGTLLAGKFTFYGSNYKFHYNKFKIDLNNVDSVQMYAEGTKKDRYGEPVLIPITTLLENVHGDILIDYPTNKSGYKPYTKYPILHSFDSSYVYYDKPDIQHGAYDKDKFYYKVFPFTMDSLDNFKNEQLAFNGKLVSGGIFPTFEDKLKLQPDYSLGLIKQTPPGGMPLYGGKGNFDNTIKLSGEGLKGDGKISYLTSTSYSDDFLFLLDSTKGKAQKFDIQAQETGVEYPPTQGKDVEITWMPYKDTLITTTLTSDLAMYDGSNLKGKTWLTPKGLNGKGVFSFQRAELTSNLYDFKYQTFSADTADFKLKNKDDVNVLNFETTDMNTFIDFKNRFGNFKSNGGGSEIRFPRNKYIAHMEEFKWFMDDKTIEFKGGKQVSDADASGLKLQGSQFISVDPKQDSLSFYSSRALYDIQKSIIYAKDVKLLRIADAVIYPDSNKVTIDNGGNMKSLENAKIVSSYVNKYHHIYKANLKVRSSHDFSGTGYIDYVELNGTKEPIFLSKIAVNSTDQTYASGTIAPSDSFMLSPKFKYNGKVNMHSNDEFLAFEGSTKIIQDCNLLKDNWIAFSAPIDAKEIYIPIDSLSKNNDGKRIYTSIMLNSEDGLYTAFISPPKKGTDSIVLPSFGYLHYNNKENRYEIASKLKIVDHSYPGQYLALNDKDCKVYGLGKISVGLDMGRVNFFTAGKIVHNQIDNDAVLDLLMGIDFFFSNKATKIIVTELQNKAGLKPLNYNRDNYKMGLQALIGKEDADEMISQIALDGQVKKIPDKLRRQIMFGDLKMKWDKKSNSYLSFGQLGISNIEKKQINKYVDGTVQIVQKRGGNILNIYIEVDANNWYFFSYERGIMQTISSDDDYNNIVRETKKKDRKLKNKRHQTPYIYMFSNLRKKRDFQRSIGK